MLADVVAHLGLLLSAVLTVLALRRWAVWSWLAAVAVLPVTLAAGLPWALGGVEATPASAVLCCATGTVWLTCCWYDRLTDVRLAGAVAAAVVGLGTGLLVATDQERADPADPALWVLLGAPAVAALVATAGPGRASSSSARWPVGLALLAPVVATALSGGDATPLIAWWPAAGALGLSALLRGRRGPAALTDRSDEVDTEAAAAFDAELGGERLAPVVVLIAAYEEAVGLPDVLTALPASICGLPAEVLVVDDGSADDTADVARATGRARVVACSRNRGQGAALRLGYRLAREHGADFVVTTDADGQYDVADLPTVLAPVVEGRADFVTGSRRLGAQETPDGVRRVGTVVFAWLATLLLGVRLTDTSFGLRAMRAEVTAAVTLLQPQYQSSELLVGVVSRGFRVLEVPATMHVRSAGSSKKGGNLVYGARYLRVMVGTWWREGAPAPLADRAPALRGPVSRGARVPA